MKGLPSLYGQAQASGFRGRLRSFRRARRSHLPGEHFRLLLLPAAYAAATLIWVLGAQVLLGEKMTDIVIIAHLVASIPITWATVLFGGLSESKRVAVAIPAICAPLATVLIIGVANFF